jgi:hypothetical protein
MADTTTETAKRKAANLFDLRRIIGGVFVGYGLLLTILGLFASDADIDKAADVNINLWAGLGMLVFGVLMFTWALTRPLSEELGHEHESEEGGRPPGLDDERPAGPDDPRPE